MTLRIDQEECLGCGACESACPQDAVTQSAGFPVVYEVDPLRCTACGKCLVVCPVDGLVADPAWAVCHGRGCPLSSHRYEGWTCSEGRDRCPSCGGMVWTSPEGVTSCPTCRAAEDGARGAACPKVRRLARQVGVG